MKKKHTEGEKPSDAKTPLENTYGDVADGLPARLREERQRMGMNQTEFGALGGVKKLTQLKYEKGESAPDSNYLRALGRVGADIGYIVMGIRSTDDFIRANAQGYILDVLSEKLGGSPAALYSVTALATEHEDWLWKRGQDLNQFDDIGPLIDAFCEDSDVLCSIFEHIRTIGWGEPGDISPGRKARTVILLYRAFKASGKVDTKMIEDAVKLSTP